jgi:hypothetical protein
VHLSGDVEPLAMTTLVGLRSVFLTLAVPTSVAPGTPQDVSNYLDKWVQIGGSFVATLSIEGSINGTDFEVVSAVTAKGIVEIAPLFKLLRINTTAFTSGTPSATFVGRDQR